jgi:hypothetical protein
VGLPELLKKKVLIQASGEKKKEYATNSRQPNPMTAKLYSKRSDTNMKRSVIAIQANTINAAPI